MKELIKFKTMQEILLTEAAYFDKHGNLVVNTIEPNHQVQGHLAPCYFSYLGGLREYNKETHFPYWCIEYKMGDTFPLEIGLKNIKTKMEHNAEENEDEIELIDAALAGKRILRQIEHFGNKEV